MADFTITEGDTRPVLTTELTYANKEVVPLEGAAVRLVMRNQTATEPVALSGTTSIVNTETGQVSYTFASSDTLEKAGMYLASWDITFASGAKMTFPTIGFIWIEVQPSLVTKAATPLLVPLPELKSYLNIPANDRTHDTKLERYIEAVRPLIENLVGPIIPAVHKEWHAGGNYFISLRRRPSTALGTNPVYNLMACSEYRGPIEYPLSIVQDPAHGTIYSCMFHGREGIVERRTSGGGVMAFPQMANAVHVVYEAGQETVPGNVAEAALETIRVNYQTTQMVGSGRATMADAEEIAGPSLGFFLPRRVRELLSPNRKAPSIF